MKKISHYFIACCLSAVVIIPGFADASSRHRCCDRRERCDNHKHSKDPIVGVWLSRFHFDTSPPDEIVDGVITFNADGTFFFHDTADLTQALVANFGIGGYLTIVSGKWERIGKLQYQLVSTNVLLARNPCEEEQRCCPTLAEPAQPVARFKLNQSFIINPDLQTAATNDAVANGFEVNDISLTQSLPIQITGSGIFQKFNP